VPGKSIASYHSPEATAIHTLAEKHFKDGPMVMAGDGVTGHNPRQSTIETPTEHRDLPHA
jgi:hypothetical protein